MIKAKTLRDSKGFTLIELMVVVIIIGILAAIAIPQFSKQSDKAKVKTAVSDIRNMKLIIDQYYLEKSDLPADTAALLPVLKDGGIIESSATAIQNDPWGNAYVYAKNGSDYKLYSLGSDKAADTNDEIGATLNTEAKDKQKFPTL